MFQLNPRLPYLPSWGPCYLFLLSHPLRNRNEAGWFLPRGPTCPSSLDKTALSSLGAASFGAPIALGVMAYKEGQEGGVWAERPSDALPSPPAVHTCSVFPLLLCTLAVCSSLLFQGSPSLFSLRCCRVVSVLKEPPWYPWGPDLALDRVPVSGSPDR